MNEMEVYTHMLLNYDYVKTASMAKSALYDCVLPVWKFSANVIKSEMVGLGLKSLLLTSQRQRKGKKLKER